MNEIQALTYRQQSDFIFEYFLSTKEKRCKDIYLNVDYYYYYSILKLFPKLIFNPF